MKPQITKQKEPHLELDLPTNSTQALQEIEFDKLDLMMQVKNRKSKRVISRNQKVKKEKRNEKTDGGSCNRNKT